MSERTSFSRRSLLAAAPAVALIPPAAIATSVVPIDAELLRLGVEYAEARAYVKTAVPPEEDYPDDFVWTDDVVVDKMCGVEAKTIDGLKVKARALITALGLPDGEAPRNWDEYLITHGGVADGLTFSIIADILAMGGGDV